MKKYTIVFDRINTDIMERSCKFLEEAFKIDGVKIEKETLSVSFETGKENAILELAKKYGIVNLINK
ncbi:MAG: hypothetical protein IKX61_00290 [Prevotella sp.]|nr:hypothetical protein [Prevotella sp.]